MLLIHGVTASHLSWPFVAERLPDARVIAPDLRGRGRSNDARRARRACARTPRDLVAVLDALGVERVVVVGHSMGAFVALVFGRPVPRARRRASCSSTAGCRSTCPRGCRRTTSIRFVLGPTADRLAMRFATVDEYLDFWRAHPAFRRDWSPELEAYLAYDLVGDEPELRPSTSYATLEEDSIDQNTGTAIVDALAHLRHPTVLLTAERGLLDQLPALYAAERLPALLSAYPGLEHVAVPDVNHYTITLSAARCRRRRRRRARAARGAAALTGVSGCSRRCAS